MVKKILYFLILPVLFIILSLGCSAATDDDDDNNQNYGYTRVLILSNEEDGNNWIDSTYVKHMSDIEFSSFNIGDSIPTLDDFEGFDVVLLYEDGIFSNSTESGDVLYDFVLAGGNLVIGTFYWQDRSDGGWTDRSWGDLEMVDPIFFNSCDYTTDSLGAVITHPLTAGVNSLVTYYRGGVDSLREGATAVAWWADGDILIAFNRPHSAGTITAVTTAPHEGYYWDSRQDPDEPQGDFFKLWENALKWTASQGSGFSKNAVKLSKQSYNRIKPAEQNVRYNHSGGGRGH